MRRAAEDLRRKHWLQSVTPLDQYLPVLSKSQQFKFNQSLRVSGMQTELLQLRHEISEQSRLREMLEFLDRAKAEQSIPALDSRVEQLIKLCSTNIPDGAFDFGYQRHFSRLNNKVKRLLNSQDIQERFFEESLSVLKRRRIQVLRRSKQTLPADPHPQLEDSIPELDLRNLEERVKASEVSSSVLPSSRSRTPKLKELLKKKLLKVKINL